MRLETERLIIREWQDADRAPYSHFVANPEVRRYFFSMLSRSESDAIIGRLEAVCAQHGFSFLPVVRKSDGALIGHTGLLPVGIPVPGSPPVEIGWMLGRQYWGHGYAPEAARAWIEHAFAELRLTEVVAWTAVGNLASQRVMQKLGMTTNPAQDFDHPQAPMGHPLTRHVLYRIANPD